jgi:hypothetical protein
MWNISRIYIFYFPTTRGHKGNLKCFIFTDWKLVLFLSLSQQLCDRMFWVFIVYSFIHMCIHWAISPHPTPASHPPPFQAELCPVLQFCWRENIRDKKDKAFLLVWNKDGYTERYLALLPCTPELQPKLVHLDQTCSLLPGHLPIVASISLGLLYSLPYSGHVKHCQVLGFPAFPIPPIR